MDRNFECLAKKNLVLYEKLKLIEPVQDIFPCADGRFTAKVHTIEEKQVWLNSKYNINRDIEKALTGLNLNLPIIVWLGIGMGYEVKALFKSKLKSTKLIIIEPRLELLKTAMQYSDLQEMLICPDVYILGGTPHDIKAQLNPENTPLIEELLGVGVSIELYEHPYSKSLYQREELQEISIVISQEIQYYAFYKGNSAEDTLLGINHFFSNMKYIFESPIIAGLGDIYRGYPAICVASGPSLDKNIQVLKEIQDKALIFCTDSIWDKLMSCGIVPDAITALERTKHVYTMFFQHKQDQISQRTCLIGQSVIYPRIFEEYSGKKIVCTKASIPFEREVSKEIPTLNNYSTGISCAHTSFGIAKALGCNPIIVIGQDLAYGEHGYSHAKGTWGDGKTVDDFPEYKTYFVQRIDRAGKVLTDELYDLFRHWFEGEVKKDPSFTYINATEGGAYIAGMDVMTLRVVDEKYLQHGKEKIPLYMALDKHAVQIDQQYVQEHACEYFQAELMKLKEVDKGFKEIIKLLDEMKLSRNQLEFAKQVRLVVQNINHALDMISTAWVKSEVFFNIIQYDANELKKRVNANKQMLSLQDIQAFYDVICQYVMRINHTLEQTIYEYERGINIIRNGGVCDNIDTPLMGEMYE